MEVSQQQTLAVIGEQALELSILRGQVNRFAQHQCVPTPCQRECCATNPEPADDKRGDKVPKG